VYNIKHAHIKGANKSTQSTLYIEADKELQSAVTAGETGLRLHGLRSAHTIYLIQFESMCLC